MTEPFEFPEGATPIADCSGLIPTWVHQIHDLNRVEAENIMEAQRKYLKGSIDHPNNWFNIEKLKSIHRTMFGKVWSWAGIYRKSSTSIGIKPNQIPYQLAQFCHEVISRSQHPTELTFLEMAARIHHQLVFIHPFENGNGRFSRLIADRFLLAWKCPHPVWPNLNLEGKERKDYILALKSADQGDYAPLLEYMRKCGARDPSLSELLQNRFYRMNFTGEKGTVLVTALLRNGEIA